MRLKFLLIGILLILGCIGDSYSDTVVVCKDMPKSQITRTGSWEISMTGDSNSMGLSIPGTALLYVIKLSPMEKELLQVCEMVGYNPSYLIDSKVETDSDIVVHRIVDVQEDKGGMYYIVKGDNNHIPDGKIRPNGIVYLIRGINWSEEK